MTHYLLTVHGPSERNEFGNYDSKEQMEEAFSATGATRGPNGSRRRWRPASHARSSSS